MTLREGKRETTVELERRERGLLRAGCRYRAGGKERTGKRERKELATGTSSVVAQFY